VTIEIESFPVSRDQEERRLKAGWFCWRLNIFMSKRATSIAIFFNEFMRVPSSFCIFSGLLFSTRLRAFCRAHVQNPMKNPDLLLRGSPPSQKMDGKSTHSSF